MHEINGPSHKGKLQPWLSGSMDNVEQLSPTQSGDEASDSELQSSDRHRALITLSEDNENDDVTNISAVPSEMDLNKSPKRSDVDSSVIETVDADTAPANDDAALSSSGPILRQPSVRSTSSGKRGHRRTVSRIAGDDRYNPNINLSVRVR